jgi:hypothetical protein
MTKCAEIIKMFENFKKKFVQECGGKEKTFPTPKQVMIKNVDGTAEITKTIKEDTHKEKDAQQIKPGHNTGDMQTKSAAQSVLTQGQGGDITSAFKNLGRGVSGI